jgi:nicotinamidase-related amidase
MDTALLLIDIQYDYFPGGAFPLFEPVKAAGAACSILVWFRARQQPIVHVQHISTQPGATFFKPGTDGAEFEAALAPHPGEHVVTKHFPNSFRETDLEAHLKSLGVKNLVVCGMMTHMCVDATVRVAKDLGYSVTLIGDACATRKLEYRGGSVPAKFVQRAFLSALAQTYAEVVTADEYIEKSARSA